MVIGQYGEGRTVAFTGFTPEYAEKRAFWDLKIEFPYLVDQELTTNPVNAAYFGLFMRMLAAATGQQPATPYDEILLARDKPLFEMLQDSPPATLKTQNVLEARAEGSKATLSLDITNGPQYARLVRIRAEWEGPKDQVPYLVKYSDNYFDLLPGENKRVGVAISLPQKAGKVVRGHFSIQGSNVPVQQMAITLNGNSN